MKYPTVFHLVSDLIHQKGIRCLLIGGFAVNYYKVTRQTADIDFLTTKEDFEKISGLLEEEGFKREDVQEVFARLKAEGSYLMDIDFMFVDTETLDKMIKESKEIKIAGQKLTVPCLDHLIALKMHALKYNPKVREYKDLSDIVELVRVNQVNAKGDSFKKLCLKYGTEELYRKILERV